MHVDDLARKLVSDPPTIGVHVHRARAKLASVGVRGAAALVERRRSTRQLRLGTDRFEIVLI